MLSPERSFESGENHGWAAAIDGIRLEEFLVGIRKGYEDCRSEDARRRARRDGGPGTSGDPSSPS